MPSIFLSLSNLILAMPFKVIKINSGIISTKNNASKKYELNFSHPRNFKNEKLVISSTMFGRYPKSLLSGFKKPKCSYYQLYLYGYHDARKNHDVFSKYFENKHKHKP
jgi:hypothetical protein